MDETHNPYSPPRPPQFTGRSWWQQFVALFAPERSQREKFLAGAPIIHYGVMFFVDPDEAGRLHVAMPVDRLNDQSIARNIAEVLRVWPEFEVAYPQLKVDIKNREVVVRMISSYQDFNTMIGPATNLGVPPFLARDGVSPPIGQC